MDRMEQRGVALTLALRVLTAINEKRHPDQAEVELLRELSNLPAQTAIDQMACQLIEQAIQQVPASRKATGASGGAA
jgi:hypothetical protein